MSLSVEERVKQIVVNQLGVEEAAVIGKAKFIEDLGADSLDIVELVMATEGVITSLWAARPFFRIDHMIIWIGVVLLLSLVIDLLLRLAQHLLRPGRRDDVPPMLR